MKYVLTWAPRPGGSWLDNEASGKRLMEVASKWSPHPTVHQFVTRIDGEGGFAVLETDNPEDIARDCAIFAPYFVQSVHPVTELDRSMSLFQESVEFRDSVS